MQSLNPNPSLYHDLLSGLGEVPPKCYSGEYGSCRTLIIETVEGSTEDGGSPIPPGEHRTVYASRTVLRSKLEKALERGLKAGDNVAIQHFGRPEGREYENYDLKFSSADQLAIPESDDGTPRDEGIPF